MNGKSNPSKERRKPEKRKEKLSTRDIEDLMGIRGPRYERRRGALRQKVKLFKEELKMREQLFLICQLLIQRKQRKR